MPAQFVDDGHGDQHGDDDCPGQPAGERIESCLHTSAGGSTEYKHTKKSSILVLPAPPAAPPGLPVGPVEGPTERFKRVFLSRRSCIWTYGKGRAVGGELSGCKF